MRQFLQTMVYGDKIWHIVILGDSHDIQKLMLGRRKGQEGALYGKLLVVVHDTDFSHTFSCLFVHYPFKDFAWVDSNQVSFNTLNDSKFKLFGPGKKG